VVVFLGGCIPSGLKCVLFKNIFLKNYFWYSFWFKSRSKYDIMVLHVQIR
jgi:hypothetical protein